MIVYEGVQSKDLKEYLINQEIAHTRGAPYHPQTQGKIERFHRSMKNVVKLDNYYYPWELNEAVAKYIDFYNNHRYHEALNNVTPADVYFGRYHQIESERTKIKNITMQRRKEFNLKCVV